MCKSDDEEKLSIILRILDEDGGGIYVGENTIIKHFAPKRRHQHFEFSIQRDDINSGNIVASACIPTPMPTSTSRVRMSRILKFTGYILLRTGIRDAWIKNITYSNIVSNPRIFKANVQTCSPLEILQTFVYNFYIFQRRDLLIFECSILVACNLYTVFKFLAYISILIISSPV